MWLRVTHTGSTQSSVHLGNLDSEFHRTQPFNIPTYVKYLQSVVIPITSMVRLSMEQGSIKGLADSGIIEIEVIGFPADTVPYSSITTGMAAASVQEALDELFFTSQGVSIDEHTDLYSLPHNVYRDGFEEYIYVGSKVAAIILWTDAGKSQKIREWLYTYVGTQVTTEVVIQYNYAGTEIQRLSMAYTYVGTLLSNVVLTRSDS